MFASVYGPAVSIHSRAIHTEFKLLPIVLTRVISLIWTVFLRDTKGPSIHVDVTLTCTTYLAIVADHVQYTLSLNPYSPVSVTWFSSVTHCITIIQE